MSESPADIKSLFGRAIEIESPEERTKFLNRVCGENAELKRELEALLAAHDQSGSFMKAQAESGGVATELHRANPLPDLSGTRIGSYKLLQLLGEGGMGSVYMAEQFEPVRRRVALKVIKAGMDTQQVVARFEAERQALALMDHQHIAHVLDAGATEAGRPYFVMELVKGVPITEYCDRNRLTPRERLELFIPVCIAIQHAHQKGIIHRDIKPSNVLVALYDGRPVPKVIDFGVAKAIDTQLTQRTMFTEVGQVVGTMEYMSPEQAEMNQLDVDTRTDIYSLGVVLYELLTGSTPITHEQLRKAGFAEMLRAIRDSEPPRPSTRVSESAEALPSISAVRKTEPAKLSRLLRGELDWIVMRALEKDRTRRYETANGLAADIGRFLSDETVEACPPSVAYRFGKFARRNKSTLAAGAVLAAALLLGSVVSVWQAVRALRAEEVARTRLIEVQREKDRADVERERAEQETVRAVEAEKLAEERLAESEEARAEAEAVSGFLTTAFARANPSVDSRTVTVAETLDHAAKNLEFELANHPGRKARLQVTIGDAYASLGFHKAAAPLFEQAYEYRRKVLGPQHLDTLATMHRLGWAQRKSGEIAAASKIFDAELAIRRTVQGDTHDDTLSTISNLAATYLDSGRVDEATAMHEGVVSRLEAIYGAFHAKTLSAKGNLSVYYERNGRTEESLRLREEVYERQLSVLGKENPATLNTLVNLAAAYNTADRLKEALRTGQQAVLICRRVLGPDHTKTLLAACNLANYFERAGQLDDAIEISEDTLERYQRTLGVDHPHTLWSMAELAKLYERVDRREEARRLREETSRLTVGSKRLDHADTLAVVNRLADYYAGSGRIDEAVELKQRAIDERREALGNEHALTIAAMLNLATLYNTYELHRLKAAPLAEQAVRLYAATLGEDDPQTLQARRTLAELYHSVGDWGAYTSNRRQIFESLRERYGAEDSSTLTAMWELAISHGRRENWEDCFDTFDKLIEIRERIDGSEHENTLRVRTSQAWYYRMAERYDESIRSAEAAYNARKRTLGAEHQSTLDSRDILLQALSGAERRDKLLKLARDSQGDAEDSPHVWLIDSGWHRIWSMASGPNRRRVAAVHAAIQPDRRGVLTMLAADTGAILWQNADAHSDEGNGVSFSHDGALLVSCGDDGRVRLWDAEAGEHVRDFAGFKPGASVTHATFSPDDRLVAAGGGDYRFRNVGDLKIRLWDRESGRLLAELEGHTGKVRRLIFGPDDERLYSCDVNGELIAWDLETHRPAYRVQVSDRMVWALALSPDGRTIATGDDRGAVKLWNTSDGKPIRQLRGNQLIWSLAFSPNGGLLAAGGKATKVWVWDAASGDMKAEFPAHLARVNGVTFSADGESIVSGDQLGHVRRWQIDAYRPQATE